MKSALMIIISLIGVCIRGSDQKETGCYDNTQFKCKTGKCISMNWRCDGDPDCGGNDLSDEENCDKKNCGRDEFQCTSGKCILKKWRCDGDPDCPDGSDEDPKACTAVSCKDDEFRCNNGLCIPLNWKCDGNKDCVGTGEDELSCESKSCSESEMECGNGKCISMKWKCDGEDDCGDKSDEMNCTLQCTSKQFQCVNKRCIPKDCRCDGNFDCDDRSDEQNCPTNTEKHSCLSSTEWTCQIEKQCILQHWKCDGDVDCFDGTDEINCNNTNECTKNQFQCGTGHCIDNLKLCNGETDCSDGTDEINCSSDDPCKVNNGGCDHICEPMGGGKLQCACENGYKLVNKTMCINIDECQENPVPVCSQKCTDTTGHYNCSCVPGYRLEHILGQLGKTTCKIEGDRPWLLFANKHDVRRLKVGTWQLEQVVNELGSAVSIDFYKDKYVYWSDVMTSTISRSERRNRTMGNKEEIIKTNIRTPDGIAIDWVHDLLYWTDTGLNTIMVSNLDGSKMTTLISDGLDEPRGIAVDPKYRFMYITDWGKNPKIERIGLDGSNRKTIASDVVWPNGITIDYIDSKIFWIDAKLHKIMIADMDGNNVRTVIHNARQISHPFALAVFEDEVYWTDWSSASISKANKRTGEDYLRIALGLDSPMDIKIQHESIQQPGYNPCAHQNGGCGFLCLPRPGVSMTDPNAIKVTCACPDGEILSHNAKNCIAKDKTESSISTSTSTTEKIEDLQNVIAKKITDAKAVPTFGYNDEYDVSELLKMNALENKKETNYSLMPYLLKAISVALNLYPMLNSVVDDSFENITVMADHNIGIVMDGPNGVIVPNVKNVQTLNISEIADELDRLEKPLLQNEQFEASDLIGGTFSVSWVDGTCSRPVILPNEVAIGAFGRVRVLPRYDEFGNLTKRHIICASWSTDYRIIKGTYISRFSNRVKSYVENPDRF